MNTGAEVVTRAFIVMNVILEQAGACNQLIITDIFPNLDKINKIDLVRIFAEFRENLPDRVSHTCYLKCMKVCDDAMMDLLWIRDKNIIHGREHTDLTFVKDNIRKKEDDVIEISRQLTLARKKLMDAEKTAKAFKSERTHLYEIHRAVRRNQKVMTIDDLRNDMCEFVNSKGKRCERRHLTIYDNRKLCKSHYCAMICSSTESIISADQKS
jgi:hypothetical protein